MSVAQEVISDSGEDRMANPVRPHAGSDQTPHQSLRLNSLLIVHEDRVGSQRLFDRSIPFDGIDWIGAGSEWAADLGVRDDGHSLDHRECLKLAFEHRRQVEAIRQRRHGVVPSVLHPRGAKVDALANDLGQGGPDLAKPHRVSC